MKIRQVGAELLHADGRTDGHDGHDEVNSRIFCHFVSEPKSSIAPFRDKEGYSFLQV